jgi:site-specific DNA-methyltransferase (adenine-specific)
VDVGSARALAEQDRFQFEYWAMSLLEALPRERGRRGPDRGIDGVVHFIDGPRRTTMRAIVQVKSGRVEVSQVRDLVGTVERESAALGLFITLENPTREMRREAAAAGFYHSDLWQRDFPKIQLLTIRELLEGREFEIPAHPSMYQPAQRTQSPEGFQGILDEAFSG